MNSVGEIVVFQDEDGVLILGDEKSLAELEPAPGVVSRVLSPRALGTVGQALSTAGEAQAQSGRWLKLTTESAAYVKRLGPAKAKADGLMTGVARGDRGRIVRHLKFEHAGLLTPAAPAMLGAIATQMALDSALDEITTYLATMDAKLDRLLKQRKIEALGQLGGVTFCIGEARALLETTGTVSKTTWSKIQTNSAALNSMQAEAVEQLGALSESIQEAGDDPDKLQTATAAAKEETPFWLGVLARVIMLENKQYILELAHVVDHEATQLADHRRGIAQARHERLRAIGKSLQAIEKSLQGVAELPNLRKVTNPFKVGHIVGNVNDVNRQIADFAARVEIEGLGVSELAHPRWSAAVQRLIGDGAELATETGHQVGDRARELVQRLADARDDATLRKAARITERRDAARRQLDDEVT